MKLLDLEFAIVEENAVGWAPHVLGVADIIESRILLREGLQKDMRDQTLVHEVIHLIADITGVPLSEDQTRQMTAGVYSFMVNNPELMMDIIGEELCDKEEG